MSETPAEETAPDQVTPVASETQGYQAPGGGVRPSIRDRIMARRPYSAELVTLEDGVEVEVRTISLGLRAEMYAAVVGEDGLVDNKKMQATSILHQTYDPETGERVFADDDFDNIQGRDADYLQPIITAANKLSGTNKAAEEVREDEAKKS